MSDHILMARATRRPYRAAPVMPDHAKYDAAKGYWVGAAGPLIHEAEFAGGPFTKKRDIETGEDQKGE